jgi:glycosidase
LYRNPYELVTFYDNHDMARLNATDNGFIDAHNWLFTARGIPAVYYGSETGFMRGRPEHAGNRNYFGQERVDAAPRSPIYQALKSVANVRATRSRCSAACSSRYRSRATRRCSIASTKKPGSRRPRWYC